MTLELESILALTCAAPATAGLLRIRKTEPAYSVLVYIFLAALAVEVIDILQRYKILHDSDTLINIYTAANTLMHIYFFRRMGVLVNKKIIASIITAFALVYFFSILYCSNSCAIIAAIASYIIILGLSIEGVIQYTLSNITSWLKETVSLFCLINILYAAHFIFLFSFRLISLSSDIALKDAVENIHSYLNAACNLLFTWPILCIPCRKN